MVKNKKCNKCDNLVQDINLNTEQLFKTCIKCREYSRRKNIEWKQRNPQIPADSARKRRKTHKTIISQQRRNNRQKLRQKVLDMYGRKCEHCGEIREKMLTIDHINGDGGKHRKKVGKQSEAICKDVLKEYRPDLYQILCIACNWHKGMFGYLPNPDYITSDWIGGTD